MEALVEPTIARWFPPESVANKPPLLDKVRAMIRATPIDGFAGCAEALADYDYARPRHGATGRRSASSARRTRRAAGMRKLHEELRGSRHVELPGAGHISNLDQPAAFTKAIRDFLAAAD